MALNNTDSIIIWSILDLYAENEDDDMDCQEEYEVIEIAPNRFKTTFHVPQ